MCDSVYQFNVVRFKYYHRSLITYIKHNKVQKINKILFELSLHSLFNKKKRIVKILKDILGHVATLNAFYLRRLTENIKVGETEWKLCRNLPVLEELLEKIYYDKAIVEAIIKQSIIFEDGAACKDTKAKLVKLQKELVETEKTIKDIYQKIQIQAAAIMNYRKT